MENGSPEAHIRTVNVVYTENIVRDAVRTFVWRRGVIGRKSLWLAEAAMLAFFIWLLWKGEQESPGPASPRSGNKPTIG
ncbi:MAG: hypothetical protein ACK5MQ_17035 [Pikeienuella sp.]